MSVLEKQLDNIEKKCKELKDSNREKSKDLEVEKG